jgi:uncharacterized protein (DUF433 family)
MAVFSVDRTLDACDIINIMDLSNRITTDPEICHGKPCIRGLRYPVETILELLSSGMTEGEILTDYEELEHEDILAVLSYATKRQPALLN